MPKKHARTAVFWRQVQDLMGEAPLIVPADRPVEQVVRAMAEAERTAAVIADSSVADEVEGAVRPLGILTEEDIVRRITFKAAPDRPVREFMTAPLYVVGHEDYLYTAIARMRRRGLRHMPVVDDTGRPLGILRLAEAYEAAGDTMLAHLDRITSDDTLSEMRAVKEVQVALAEELRDDGLPAPEIQRVLTHLNNDLCRRVCRTNVEAMMDEGYGPPPKPFAMIVMGSGGRGENFLYPDQDNGFVIEDYPDEDHTEIDAWFLELADRVTRDLDGIGIPLCKGNVMATNPLWRKTLLQWKEQTRLWVETRTSQAIRNADIFLDFRWVYGERYLVAALREHISAITGGDPKFMNRLLRDEGADKVAIGWLNRLVTDKKKPEHKGEVDLKHNGTMPLVQGIRLMALRDSVMETATLDRIEALKQKGSLKPDRADALSQAFVDMTTLLLKRQLVAFRDGGKVGNHVKPESLEKPERERLVRAFKTVQAFRNTLRYTLVPSSPTTPDSLPSLGVAPRKKKH